MSRSRWCLRRLELGEQVAVSYSIQKCTYALETIAQQNGNSHGHHLDLYDKLLLWRIIPHFCYWALGPRTGVGDLLPRRTAEVDLAANK